METNIREHCCSDPAHDRRWVYMFPGLQGWQCRFCLPQRRPTDRRRQDHRNIPPNARVAPPCTRDAPGTETHGHCSQLCQKLQYYNCMTFTTRHIISTNQLPHLWKCSFGLILLTSLIMSYFNTKDNASQLTTMANTSEPISIQNTLFQPPFEITPANNGPIAAPVTY